MPPETEEDFPQLFYSIENLKDKMMKTNKQKILFKIKTDLRKQIKIKNHIVILQRNKMFSGEEHNRYSWKSCYLT